VSAVIIALALALESAVLTIPAVDRALHQVTAT
jgi:hypothetical protein